MVHQTPRRPQQPEIDIVAFFRQLDDLIRTNQVHVSRASLGTVYFSYFDDRHEEPFRVYVVWREPLMLYLTVLCNCRLIVLSV
jgi:hypothetical protein